MNAPNKARDEASQQQRIAADPNVSAFVTANAGSGKTKVLVDRIARLLLAGSRPSSFLCITYTKAAANEMQRRLFERLGEWCVADDAKLADELQKLVGAEGPAPIPDDLARARALFAAALETPGGLKIQTIHAFCERLLARFPIEAGVAPGFDIADDARAELIKRAARANTILSADAATHAAFERFATRFAADALESLFDRLAANAEDLAPYADDLERLAARHGGAGEPEDILRAALAAAPWDDLTAAIAPLEGSTTANQNLAAVIRAALNQRDAAAEAAFAAYESIFLTKQRTPRAREPTQAIKDKNAFIARLFAPDGEAQRVLDVIERVNAAERAKDAIAMVVLAARLGREFDQLKAQSGVLDFADLIAHAHALLARSDAAEWVQFKLDGGLDHVLIDEGQDTSPTQWDVIAPIQQEFFAGRGAREKRRTVFAVGDPKQSIYAFQGADPDRFLNETRVLERRVREAGETFVAPVLETSFRSTPEVLKAVDVVFAKRNLAAGAIEGENIVTHAASRDAEAGLVEVWPIARKGEVKAGEPWDAPLDTDSAATAAAILAHKLANTVKQWIADGEAVWDKGALRPMRAGDVLVLVRKRGGLFRELIRNFKRVGLPVAGADRMVLKEELAVEDCLALMRVALDPEDDLSLACVLKGPWLGLDDDDKDIFPLAHGRAPGERLVHRLRQSSEEKYANARALVEALAARAGAHPFDFLSWALETECAGPGTGRAKLLARLGAEAREPIEELLARALKPSPLAAPTLQRFLRDIESDENQVKREMEAAGENVRIMTVHGAKGLEAPVVILPDTTGPVNAKADDGLIRDETGPYLLGAKDEDDAATRRARERMAEKALSEHWRLLYVAMTRARDRLIVCGAQHGGGKEGEASESWRAAVNDALQQIGAPCETPFGEGRRFGAPLRAAIEKSGAHEGTRLPDWISTSAPGARRLEIAAPSRAKKNEPALLSPRGEGQKRFRRGRLIHGLLQRLPDIASDRRLEAAQAWLERQGAEPEESEAFAREAIAVVGDARFAALFASTSRAEVPIVGDVRGKHVRGVVDRLAIEGDAVLLLDFKTDRPAPMTAESAPAPYVLQMALYQAVMRQIFPRKAVRCALLWTEAPLLVLLQDAQLESQLEAFLDG